MEYSRLESRIRLVMQRRLDISQVWRLW